jgi:3',5'-cyclic AMP phosphodiesterase CpdA
MPLFSVGHVSDLHSTPVAVGNPIQLLNKRFLGWLSWRLRRRKIHRPAVLEALIEDLAEAAPDHLLVTGDLTNISLEPEFAAARVWLDRLGEPHGVSLVPGNHDAYVAVPHASSWSLWSEFIASDDGSTLAPDSDPREQFPTLRIRGPLAVVGLCSALPTGAFDASGTLGFAQLNRLEGMLAELATTDLCRVVSIHHPITEGATIARRMLTDALELRELLGRTGAELVVHGHNHRTLSAQIPGPQSPIPVVGVRSASDFGHKPHKRAQYHLYEFERLSDSSGPRFRIVLRTRGYDPATGGFIDEGETELPGSD